MKPFQSLIGQEQAVELLMQAVNKNRVAPAYLFVGADGIGKSLAARYFIELLFAEDETAVNKLRTGNHPDVLWVKPTYLHQGQRLTAQEAIEKGLKRKTPPSIRLEQVREITHFLARPPLHAPRNIIVIEQAETMAEAAANALLKTLEEPGNATLILIAPSPDAILPTLVSRCQRIPFYRLSPDAIAQVLVQTGDEEILHHPAILNLAQGSPGNAIASYTQLQSIPEDLLYSLANIPTTVRGMLELAKTIDKTLDMEAQLWLVDYLQQIYWQNTHQGAIIQQLEKTRKYLLAFAQPRLVWECTLLQIQQLADRR